MDNLFFRYFFQNWPVILAIIITVLLIYQRTRPKVNPEKLHKGIIKQNILSTLEDEADGEIDGERKDWLKTRQQMEKYLINTPIQNGSQTQQIHYRSHITISLIWTLFWIGIETFLIIRICFVPYFYRSEAIFLGYFTYYIIIGLISYFKR